MFLKLSSKTFSFMQILTEMDDSFYMANFRSLQSILLPYK